MLHLWALLVCRSRSRRSSFVKGETVYLSTYPQYDIYLSDFLWLLSFTFDLYAHLRIEHLDQISLLHLEEEVHHRNLRPGLRMRQSFFHLFRMGILSPLALVL